MADDWHRGLEEPRDWLKSSLDLLSMIGFLGTIYLLSIHEIKEGARDIIMVLTGVMAGIAKDVYSYFFGSSAKGNSGEIKWNYMIL